MVTWSQLLLCWALPMTSISALSEFRCRKFTGICFLTAYNICCPLQYNTRMSSNKVAMLIALTWFFPLLAIIVMISLNASLQLCDNVIDGVFCNNYSVVKLACYDTTVNNLYGLIYTFVVLFGLTVLILYPYMKIFRVCLRGSKQTRQKAVSTCTPHLASLLNFSCGCFLEIVQSRFNMSSAPIILRMFLSLYFIICQPLYNPLLYGLNRQKSTSNVKVFCLGKCN